MNRRGALTALAGGFAAAAIGTPILAAPALNFGNGTFRRISFVNSRLEERLDAIYWIDGEYVPEVLQEVSNILRDWRADSIKSYDPAVIDVLAAAHHKLGTSEPYDVVSGYRCAATNAMLRGRSSGVAKNSYHLKAMAVDIRLKGRSVRQIAGASESLGAGGVGRYSRSQFVHMDCGPARTWGA